ncbi:MAG: RNA polymerase sigma-70 factor [Cyclobacteriaceae bacterium]
MSRRKSVRNNPDIRTTEGFTILYETYVEFVFDICYRYLGELAPSQNITSEIFTSLWERRNVLYEDDWKDDSWKRYLSKAAKHKLYDFLRRQEQSKRYVSTAVQERLLYENTTEETLSASELSEQVNMVVNQLPPRCKEVFQLSRDEGLSYQEISEHLSISVNAVNKHISKALKSLRDHLVDYQLPNKSTGS